MKPVAADWLTRPGGIVERLGALRSRSGLRGKELAERLGWTATRVSKLENGRQMPTEADLRAWAEACGFPAEGDDLAGMLDEYDVVRLRWRNEKARGAELQVDHEAMAEAAAVIRNFELATIPGLLQVPEYARELLANLFEVHGFEDNVDDAVRVRLRRQDVLYAPGKRFEFVVGESALRYLRVPAKAMAPQLDRLLAVAGAPNIRLGIVPFGVHLRSPLYDSFVTYDDVAVVETRVERRTYAGEDGATYVADMDRLWLDAVEGAEARALILAAAEALR